MPHDPRRLVARLDALKAERASTDAFWQEVADFVLPSRAFTTRAAPGSRRSAARSFNSTPGLACEQLAGALHGMLTSPSLRWFSLRPDDPALAEDQDARTWFEHATDRMYMTLTSTASAFDTAMHEMYLDLCGFGTGVIFIADRPGHGVYYEARPLAECYMAQGADGRIDTLIREWDMPLREVARLWPDRLPDRLAERLGTTPDAPICVMHAVIPQDGKWCSEYWLREPATLLEEQRPFRSFPFAAPRWSKRSGEVYGFSPAMGALADIKLLNRLEEIQLRAHSRAVDPVVLLPDDGFLNQPTARPGGIMYFRAGAMGLDRIQALPSGRVDIGVGYIEMIQERVRRSFYIDWMNLPSQPNMTATEVLQRRDEMLRVLGPMVARVQAELLGPLIERTFDILAHAGAFPPLPPVLAQRGYRVEYQGPLAVAQRASDADSVLRLFNALAQLAQVAPDVTQVIDAEASARFLSARLGVPADLMRDPRDIAAARAQQARAAEAGGNMDAAAAAADAAQRGTGALANLATIAQQAGGVG